MFYCTKLDWSARQILTVYSYRWAIEMFHPEYPSSFCLYHGSGAA